MSDIVIFEVESQQVQVRLEGETLWLSLQQLADLFGRDKSVISRHLKNIFDTSELERERAVAKNAIVQERGGAGSYPPGRILQPRRHPLGRLPGEIHPLAAVLRRDAAHVTRRQ